MEKIVTEPTKRRRMIILAICCLSLLIVSMDSTVVNIAVPAIHADLGASMSLLQWVIDIYTVTLASLLMLSGATADRIGRRRVFQTGLITFAASSMLCGLAPNIETLLCARLLQGIGGSMLTPVALSIITQVFTNRAERAQAIGIFSSVLGLSMAVGPLLGGIMMANSNWRMVFWINLPICAATFLLTRWYVPESKAATTRKADPVGQLLGTIFVAALVFGLIDGPQNGWTQPVVLASFSISILALTVFLRHETRHPSPFVDLRFFRSVPFASATAIAVLAFSSYGAFLLLGSLYLQNVQHYSAIRTGLQYLPPAIGMIICAPLSGRLVARFGTRPSLVAASIMMAGAMAAFSMSTLGTPIWLLTLFAGAFGFGFGMVNAPITNSAVSGMPIDQAGAAAAVTSTSRQIGVSIGVALSGAFTTGGNYTDRTLSMYGVFAVFAVVIGLIGIISTTAWARRTTTDIAPLLAAPTPQTDSYPLPQNNNQPWFKTAQVDIAR